MEAKLYVNKWVTEGYFQSKCHLNKFTIGSFHFYGKEIGCLTREDRASLNYGLIRNPVAWINGKIEGFERNSSPEGKRTQTYLNNNRRVNGSCIIYI